MTTPSDPSEFFAFKVKPMWAFFKKEHFAFWAISCYLFFEFVRPQSIFPQIDVLPYAQLFLILALAGAFVDPSVKWVSSPANKWIIFYLVWIIAATFTANYPDISKKHFMDFFGWFLIYFLMINIINSEKRFYIAVTIYLVAAAKIAIGTAKTWVMRGFSFTSWGLMGPHGYFHNSGELAVLMVMLFPLSYYLYAYGKPFLANWQKYLLMLFWIAPILTVLGASSRGAQVALAGQLILMFRKSLFKIKPLIGIVILINAIIFLLPQEQKDRFTTAGDDRTSQQRLLYWKHGATMIEENPFLGVGYFNFASYYQEHYSYDLLYSHAQLPHNILVQIGTDAGVPALLAFFMMLFFCMRTPFTSKKVSPISQYIGYGLGMGVMGYFIAGQFVTITYYPFFWIHLAFMTALFNLNAQASRPGNYLTSNGAQAPQNPGNPNR